MSGMRNHSVARMKKFCPAKSAGSRPASEATASGEGSCWYWEFVPSSALPFQLLTEDGGRQLADRISQFISAVHGAGGAVVALSYLLDPRDIDLFAAAGVDGFEVANFGHPEMTEDVREFLLKAQNTYRIALVASTDWHGWGRFGRTWTLFKTQGIASPRERSEQVIQLLRDRDPDRIVSVVSQAIGRPSPLRSIFAPFVETIRYATELSPMRVASWWLWIAAVYAAIRYFRCGARHAARWIVAGLFVTIGVLLFLRGLGLVRTWAEGAPFSFPLKIGAYSAGLGIVSFLLGCALCPHLNIGHDRKPSFFS